MKKRKTISTCGALIASAGAVILLGQTLWAVGQPGARWHPYTVASVVTELFFLLLSAVVFLVVVNSGSERLFQKLFLWMLALTAVGILGDIFAWGIGLQKFPYYELIHALGVFLRDAMGFPILVVYSIYLLSYVKEDAEELVGYGWLVSGICLDGFFLVCINQVTTRSDTQYWNLWNFPWLFLVFLALPMAANIGIIYSFRSMLTNRKAITFIVFELLVLCTVALDLVLEHATFAYSVVIFSMILIYVSVQVEYERAQEERLVRQRVAIMLSQIQPHFLYNVLTGIRVLCRMDPKKAETALLDFTSYLRSNLGSLQEEGCIPFSQELEHVRHYTELEKMRYGEELQVRFITPVTEFSLPALTLEPIVENAVRHGVMQRHGGGTVTVRTEQEAARYVITVTDDGVGFDVKTLCAMGPEHVGIANVGERLMSVCGGRLEIRSVPGEGTVVELSIPKEGGDQK